MEEGRKNLVEIDVGKLESYLTSIKDQLSRHDDELKNPVWWSAFKTEIDQVAVLSQKVEHQQLDINIIRDLLANNAEKEKEGRNSNKHSYGGISSGQESESDKKIPILAADVEGLKLLVRRIETQRAIEHNVFSQIRELQRCFRTILHLVDERAPPKALSTLMGVVGSIQPMKQQFNNLLEINEREIKKDILDKVPDMATEMSEKVYKFNRSRERECVPMTEYKKIVSNFERDIKLLNNEVGALSQSAANSGFIAGQRSIKEMIRKRLQIRQRDLLTRWVLHTIAERKIAQVQERRVMSKAMTKCRVVEVNMFQRAFFGRWISRVNMIRSWELYRIRVAKMIKYWISRVKPDIKSYLMRWKSQTILLRSAIVDEEGNPSMDLRFVIPAAQKQLEDLPENDLESKIVVLKQIIGMIGLSHNENDNLVQTLEKDLKRLTLTAENNKFELNNRIDSQAGAVASNLQKYVHKSTIQFGDITTDLELEKNKTSSEFIRVEEDTTRINKKLKSIQETLTEHDNKFDRIMMLQGDMLERLEKLEGGYLSMFEDMKTCTKDSVEANKNANKGLKNMKVLNDHVKDSLTYLDSEFKTFRENSRISTRLVEETSYKHRDLVIQIADMERSVNNRMNDNDNAVQSIQPISATPKELKELCVEFENAAVKGHAQGLNPENILAQDEHLTAELGHFVIRLANQICKATDEKTVEGIISGPQKAPPLHSGEQESARNEMINSFNQIFVRMIREHEDEPGLARAQARVVLHRRFTKALDVAIERLRPGETGNGPAQVQTESSSPSRKGSPVKGSISSSSSKKLGQDVQALSAKYRPTTAPTPNGLPFRETESMGIRMSIKDHNDRSKTDYDWATMSMKGNADQTMSMKNNGDQTTYGETEDKINSSSGQGSRDKKLKHSKSASTVDRHHAERTLSAGAVRHRSAVQHAAVVNRSAGGLPKVTSINKRQNEEIMKVLADSFAASKSIPREAAAILEQDLPEEYMPLQSRKLHARSGNL